MKAAAKFLPAGTRVRVAEEMRVPAESVWDDDKQRTSTPVKRRLQEQFFQGERKIQAEIVFISSESIRDRLKSKGLVKVQLRDPAGSSIVITAPINRLAVA